MTNAERERRALDYGCPLCKMRPHFRCRNMHLATVRLVLIRHPHKERMDLVEA